MATKEQLGEAIGVIVGEGDVAQLTLKKVRKQLATRFPGADLQPMKVRAPQPSPERTCARTSTMRARRTRREAQLFGPWDSFLR